MISASSRAKSTAPAQRAERRRRPARRRRRHRHRLAEQQVKSACTCAQQSRARRPAPARRRGGSAPASPRARSASAVARRNTCGLAAASRSIRYCAMNSRSISPPRRLRKSQGDGRGCSSAMRRRMSATSATSRSGSRGWRSAAVDRRRRSAGTAPRRRRPGARGSAPCVPRSRPTRAGNASKLREARRDRPRRARRPQPHVDLVEPTLGGRLR